MTGPAVPRVSKPVLSVRSSALLARKSGQAIEGLLSLGSLPILYWLKKDILSVSAEREYRNLEKYADRIRILQSQSPDGAWRSRKSGGSAAGSSRSPFFETIRYGLRLYDFGCDSRQPAVRKAADFIISTQDRDGLLGEPDRSEPLLSAHALALELLCRFGLDSDSRVQKGFRWLLKSQQPDGGWTTAEGRSDGSAGKKERTKVRTSSPRVTGIVLRALAESPRWRASREARKAGDWIQGSVWGRKVPTAVQVSCRWEEISYPFAGVNILSCLDALSRMDFRPNDAGVRMGLEWLLRRQSASGLWESNEAKASNEDHLWTTLAVLRVLKRFGLISP